MLEGIRERIFGNMMRDAAELMAWRGYDNVRASELARATRMSVGTLYRHYGSKRGFALKVRAFTEQQLCRHAGFEFDMQRSRSGPDFRLAFLRFWWELARFALLQPAMFCFTFLHWHPEDLKQEPRGTQVRALVRQVLTEGEREGALAQGAAKVGDNIIWGALVELARGAAQGTADVSEENILAMGETLWRALAAAEDSRPGSGGSPPPGRAGNEAGASGPASSSTSEAQTEAGGIVTLPESGGTRRGVLPVRNTLSESQSASPPPSVRDVHRSAHASGSTDALGFRQGGQRPSTHPGPAWRRHGVGRQCPGPAGRRDHHAAAAPGPGAGPHCGSRWIDQDSRSKMRTTQPACRSPRLWCAARGAALDAAS